MQEILPPTLEEQVVSISFEAEKNEHSAFEKAKELHNLHGDKIIPLFYKYLTTSFLAQLSLPTNKYKESITSFNTRSNYVQRRKIDIQNDLNNHGIHYALLKRRKINPVSDLNNNVRDKDDKAKMIDKTSSKLIIDAKNKNDIQAYETNSSDANKFSKRCKRKIEIIIQSKKRKQAEEKSIKSDELTKLMISLEATVVEKPNFLSDEKLFELISSQLNTRYDIRKEKIQKENDNPKRTKILEQNKIENETTNEDLQKNLKIDFSDLFYENIFSFKIPNLSLLVLKFPDNINETFKILINIDFEFSKKIIKNYSLDDECLYKFFVRFKDTNDFEKYFDLIDKKFLLKYNETLRFPMKLIHRVFTMNGKNISENFLVEIWDLIKNLTIEERFKLYSGMKTIDNDASVNTSRFLKRLCMNNIEFISKKLIDLCASSPFGVINEIFKSFVEFNSLIPLYIELIKCMKEYFIDFFHFYILGLLNYSDYENFECYDTDEEMDLFTLERINIYQNVDSDSSLKIPDNTKRDFKNTQDINIKAQNQSDIDIYKNTGEIKNNEFKKICTNGEYYEWFANLCFFLRNFSDLIDTKLLLEFCSKMLGQQKYLFIPLVEALLFTYNKKENISDNIYKCDSGNKMKNNIGNKNESDINKLEAYVNNGITDIFKVKKLSLKFKSDICSRYIIIWNKITGRNFFEEKIKDILLKKMEFRTIKYLIPYEIENISRFLSQNQIHEILAGIKECNTKNYHEMRNMIIFLDNISYKFLDNSEWVFRFLSETGKSTREDLRVLANSCHSKLLVKSKEFKNVNSKRYEEREAGVDFSREVLLGEMKGIRSEIATKGSSSYIRDSDLVPKRRKIIGTNSSSEEGELQRHFKKRNDSKIRFFQSKGDDKFRYQHQDEQSRYRGGFRDSKSVHLRDFDNYKRRTDDNYYRYKNTRDSYYYGKNQYSDKNISDDSSEYLYKKRN